MKRTHLILEDGSIINCNEIVSTKYFSEGDRYYVYLKSGLMTSISTSITQQDFKDIAENFRYENEEKSSENKV